MAITLGTYAFDEQMTSVTEKLEEVGGRDERRVTVKGSIMGKESAQEIHDELDLVLATASVEDYSTALEIRTGRHLMVRRAGFTRDVHGDALTGAFTLELESLQPWEESDTESALTWSIFASGDTQLVNPGGNTVTDCRISLVPMSDMVNPSFDDGENRFVYYGTVPGSSTLVLDGPNRAVTLDSADALAYTEGTFPLLAPGRTTLTFSCSPAYGQIGTADTAYRNRWF